MLGQDRQCPLMATSRLSGHVASTSALSPTADLRVSMSAFGALLDVRHLLAGSLGVANTGRSEAARILSIEWFEAEFSVASLPHNYPPKQPLHRRGR